VPTGGYGLKKSNTTEIADRFQQGGGLKSSASQGSFRGSQGSMGGGNTERDGRWTFRTDLPPVREIEGRRESVSRRAAPPPPPARRGPPPVPSRN
jgi:hypothetical protein